MTSLFSNTMRYGRRSRNCGNEDLSVNARSVVEPMGPIGDAGGRRRWVTDARCAAIGGCALSRPFAMEAAYADGKMWLRSLNCESKSEDLDPSTTARPRHGFRVLPRDMLLGELPFYLRARSVLNIQKLLDRQVNVPSDLPEETRGDFARTVERDRRPPAICMPVLPVRSPLPDLDKPQPLEQRRHLTRL